MKILTDSTVEPQITIDTQGAHVEHGEFTADSSWPDDHSGDTVDEAAITMAVSIMEAFVTTDREDATEYTFGVIRGLLRKAGDAQ